MGISRNYKQSSNGGNGRNNNRGSNNRSFSPPTPNICWKIQNLINASYCCDYVEGGPGGDMSSNIGRCCSDFKNLAQEFSAGWDFYAQWNDWASELANDYIQSGQCSEFNWPDPDNNPYNGCNCSNLNRTMRSTSGNLSRNYNQNQSGITNRSMTPAGGNASSIRKDVPEPGSSPQSSLTAQQAWDRASQEYGTDMLSWGSCGVQMPCTPSCGQTVYDSCEARGDWMASPFPGIPAYWQFTHCAGYAICGRGSTN